MSEPFISIDLVGPKQIAASLKALRERSDVDIEKTLDDAANFFIKRAKVYAPEEKGNLKRSLKKGSEVESISASFSVSEGDHGLIVGVDVTAPGTRAENVGQYASEPNVLYAKNLMYSYIDSAYMDTELYLRSKTQAIVKSWVKDYYKSAKSAIGKLAKNIRNLFGYK